MIDRNWWEQAVIYQLYPKSFQDSNDDGVGDIQGIIARLDYLVSLGVNVIWLNPMYQSPQIDNGYDVSDYYTIDPVFGTMEDMEQLIEEAHKRGIRIMFDFVLNHTSSEHLWFQEALKNPQSPYKEYFLWHEGEEGQLPNNWGSFFGGSAWKYSPQLREYYFHLFDAQMPDLNWANSEVRKAMQDIALFWLQKGIDAFRLDAFIHIAKTGGFPNVENIQESIIVPEQHIAHRPEVDMYLKEWRQRLSQEEYAPFILGEAASANSELAQRYTTGNCPPCDAIISFSHLTDNNDHKDKRLANHFQRPAFDAIQFVDRMNEWQLALSHTIGPVLYWSNHDLSRLMTRYGGAVVEYKERFAKMMATLLYLQRGIPLIYYGEEIGLTNQGGTGALQVEEAQQFIEEARQLGYTDDWIVSQIESTWKDYSRNVMQWTKEQYAGFSQVQPWTNQQYYASETVEDQLRDEQSILMFYQQLFAMRKEYDVLTKGAMSPLMIQNGVIRYMRYADSQEVMVLCNTENTVCDLEKLEELSTYQCLLSNVKEVNNKQLQPYECRVLFKAK